MTATLDARARELFLEAMEKRQPADWPEFISAACGADDALHTEVRRLLDAHSRLGRFMAEPAIGEHKASSAEAECLGTTIGPYTLKEQIGEGGMGIVYVAEQSGPIRRKVALKVIKPGMDSRQVIGRFEAERQALAMMDHPHIAKVFDGGETAEGRPYFVMELVRGTPITELCDEGQFTIRQRLALFVDVCRAVQHAHQKGIIHRDLKPNNVLVTWHDDKPVPKVIDFGVAKAVNAQHNEHSVYTHFSQVIGTPLYMSPEQAQMSALDVDTRSDVYSLGVLLYELLTGTTPFDGETLREKGLDEMRRIIREDEPLLPSHRLSTLNADAGSTVSQRRSLDPRRLKLLVSGELDWIVMRSLEKDRARRYQSVGELADDVQRYLSDLPIHARAPSFWLRVRKWHRRHPVAMVALAAAIVLSASLLVGGYWHSSQLANSRAAVQELRERELLGQHFLRQAQLANDLPLAWKSASIGQFKEARDVLERHSAPVDQPDDRGFAWFYLDQYCRAPLQTLTGHGADLLAADLSPDDRWIASSDKGGEIKIWDRAAGLEIKSLRYGAQEVCAVGFSPDGKWLATAGQDRTVRLWDAMNWNEVATFPGHTRTIYSLAWSPDSKWLASGGRDGRVLIWDVATKKMQREIAGEDEVHAVRAVAWSPDGRWLASAKGAQGMLLTDNLGTEQPRTLPPLDNVNAILACAFSLDNRYLAYGGYGGVLRVHDLEKRVDLPIAMAAHKIFSLAFTPAGELIVGGSKGVIQSFETWPERGTLHLLSSRIAETDTVRAVLPSRRGDFMITAAQTQRTIQNWRMSDVLGSMTVRSDHSTCGVFLPSPLDNGVSPEALLMSRGNQRLYLTNLRDGALRASFPYTGPPNGWPVFGAQRNLLAVPQPDGDLALWDVHTAKQWQLVKLADAPIWDMAFSADGEWLAASYMGGMTGFWELRSENWHEILPDKGQAWARVACSPTENLLAAAHWEDNRIAIWRFGEEKPLTEIMALNPVHALRISPDGKLLAATQNDHSISFWDFPSGNPRGTMRGHTNHIDAIAFSPDGTTLASGGQDGTIRLWNISTQRELFSLCQHQRPIAWLSFLSPRCLVAGDGNFKSVHVFDAEDRP